MKATKTGIRIGDLQGKSILIRESDGQCHVSTLTTPYPSAWPVDEGEVRGWGKFDGRRKWYSAGTDEPETAWHFCFAD